MTAETRITQSPGARAVKASKQFASSFSASAPLKRHVSVPLLKSTKGALSKSPSASSSDSSSGKRGVNVVKADSDNPKIAQESATDAPGDASVTSSESSAESTGTKLEISSNDLSLECTEPDETKRIIDMAEPSLPIPESQLKDLDVVHSNLAVSWFDVDDDEFDDFLKTKADQDPYRTGSEKQHSPPAAPEATATVPNSLLESCINHGYIAEFGGATSRVCSISTPPQDNKCEPGGMAVVEELSTVKTPDVTECSEGLDNSLRFEDSSTLPEASEGKGGVILASCENLMRQAGHEFDAFGGWRAIKLLLPASLLVLFTVLFCVNKLIEGELGMAPPPT